LQYLKISPFSKRGQGGAKKLSEQLNDLTQEAVDKIIDLENLKKNKQASGRLQDLADLENLLEEDSRSISGTIGAEAAGEFEQEHGIKL
jgi:hypothetical protein